ncbi:MAG: B12-binding domain-containing protein, partial [Mogibacterium sp.]|nr:B12-binding domain-containing protein [Mogibacterium sp.]
MSDILNEISTALQKGKSKQVKQLVPQALEEGIPAQQILDEALLAGMGIIGELFKNDEVFVPEVLVAAKAMNAGVAILQPYLADGENQVKDWGLSLGFGLPAPGQKTVINLGFEYIHR